MMILKEDCHEKVRQDERTCDRMRQICYHSLPKEVGVFSTEIKDPWKDNTEKGRKTEV